MTIENASLDFCNYSKLIKGFAQKTIKRYRHCITFYCKIASAQEFNQVSKENIRQLFYYGRTEWSWGVQTFLVYYKSLKVFFRWCQAQGYIEYNPIDDIEVPKLEKTLHRSSPKTMPSFFSKLFSTIPINTNSCDTETMQYLQCFSIRVLERANSSILNMRM
jgi:site-specific recombinase XerD